MRRMAWLLVVLAGMGVALAVASVGAAEPESDRAAQVREAQVEHFQAHARLFEESGHPEIAAEMRGEAERLQAGRPGGDDEVTGRLRRRIHTLDQMAATAQKEGMPDLAAQLRERAEQTERELREILAQREREAREKQGDRPRDRKREGVQSPEKTVAALGELSRNQERLHDQVVELQREVERLRETVARLERRLDEATR